MVSHTQAKSNSACPTLTNLKLGELDPPEIKLLDKLEFDEKSLIMMAFLNVLLFISANRFFGLDIICYS